LYIGNLNLISSFNEGIYEGVSPCPFGEFRRGLELVEEEEEEKEEDGGEGGGEAPFPPFPFGVLSPLLPLCFEGLEPSPCNPAFLSNKIFIISLISMTAFLRSSSSTGTRS
jgi:hypothetical protein